MARAEQDLIILKPESIKTYKEAIAAEYLLSRMHATLRRSVAASPHGTS